jgi:hypothetical protein
MDSTTFAEPRSVFQGFVRAFTVVEGGLAHEPFPKFGFVVIALEAILLLWNQCALRPISFKRSQEKGEVRQHNLLRQVAQSTS